MYLASTADTLCLGRFHDIAFNGNFILVWFASKHRPNRPELPMYVVQVPTSRYGSWNAFTFTYHIIIFVCISFGRPNRRNEPTLSTKTIEFQTNQTTSNKSNQSYPNVCMMHILKLCKMQSRQKKIMHDRAEGEEENNRNGYRSGCPGRAQNGGGRRTALAPFSNVQSSYLIYIFLWLRCAGGYASMPNVEVTALGFT